MSTTDWRQTNSKYVTVLNFPDIFDVQEGGIHLFDFFGKSVTLLRTEY
jgi:hypothetical protein